MTALLEAPVLDALGNAHDRLGRFAPKAPALTSPACTTAYRLLDLAQEHADDDPLPAGWSYDPGNRNRITIAVSRCPHGHFSRWAADNCCREGGPHTRSTTAARCTGTKTNGTPCTLRTTTTNRAGHPACSHHGGTR